MNYKLLTMEIFAILVSYLILSLPVAFADSVSSIHGNSMGSNHDNEQHLGLMETMQEFLKNVFNYLIPSVKASSCNADYTCDLASGETSSNCCFDCNCPQEYQYCDWEDDRTAGYCKDERNINLQEIDISPKSFSNCNIQHEANVTFKITNPPSGMNIDTKKLFLKNNAHSVSFTNCEITDSGSNYAKYKCEVMIPPANQIQGINCGSGSVTLNHNSVEINISFNDYKDTKRELSLSGNVPDITINSFTCGDAVCDSEIGESYYNCCLDCPCPAGEYCDITNADKSSNPGNGECKNELTESHVRILDPNPTNFPIHDSVNSDTVNFVMQISNDPVSLSVTNSVCEIECSDCTSTCSLSCTETPTEGMYNASCKLKFKINSYEKTRTYQLKPNVNFSVRYNNGTKTVSNIFEKKKPFTITIAKTLCGDGVCSSDETYSNCCYDCPCPTGEYCDYISGEPKDSGQCEQLNMELTVDNVNPSTFEIKSGQKEKVTTPEGFEVFKVKTQQMPFNITASISNKPSSFYLKDVSCSLNNDPDLCYASKNSCIQIPSEDSRFICESIIQPFFYEDYDINNNELILDNNEFNVTMEFNNGSNTVIKDLTDSFSQITLKINPECGNGICEQDLGENKNNCCLDCPCDSPKVCAGFASNCECINPDEIKLTLDFPNEILCDIPHVSGKCVFNSVNFNTQIANVPEDLVLTNYRFLFNENPEEDIRSCIADPENQNKYYNCSVDLPSIDNNVEGTEEDNITVFFDIQYIVDASLTSKTIDVTEFFTVNREKTQELSTCEQKKTDFDNDIKRAKNKAHNTLRTIKWIYGVISAVLWIVCIVVPGGQVVCPFAAFLSLGGCFLLLVEDDAGWLGASTKKIEGIKNKFNSLCGDTGVKYNYDPQTLEQKLDDLKNEIGGGLSAWNFKGWFMSLQGADYLLLTECLVAIIYEILSIAGVLSTASILATIYSFGKGVVTKVKNTAPEGKVVGDTQLLA